MISRDAYPPTTFSTETSHLTLLNSPWLGAGLFAGLGLCIGSFLNVLIYRLPKMMQRQWQIESALHTEQAPPASARFDLLLPASHCPHCQHPLAAWENIPVVSYILLGGQCSTCKTRISLRYPAVEISIGAWFSYCYLVWGITPTAALWCAFGAIVLALALIDWQTMLLPDSLTLGLLWLGLVGAALKWLPVTLHSAVWGVVAGYLSLWLVFWGFKLLTGKDGMGYGDFKLFAALGAWFGWQSLIPIIFLAAVTGVVVGIAMKFSTGLRQGNVIPFGPFLAAAGLTAVLVQPATLRAWFGLQHV